VHGPARPEWIHPSTGRPARQGFNPDEAIGAVMATKKKRSKKAAKKKAYYSGRKEKRAKKK